MSSSQFNSTSTTPFMLAYYDYDALGRVTNHRVIATSQNGLNYVYTYVDASTAQTSTRVKSVDIRKNTSGGTSDMGYKYEYAYDVNGNISEVKIWRAKTSATPSERIVYTYDAYNQVTAESHYIDGSATANSTVSYTYDAGGNITSKGGISYTYGDANWKDKLTAYNGQTLTYDAIGNPLQYRDGWTFTWSRGKTLDTAAKTGYNISYNYDGDGMRVRKTVNGTLTEYVRDADGTLVSQTSGSDVMWYHTDGNGETIGFTLNASVYFYMKNAQGDVIGITDNAGNILATYEYDTWGKLLSTGGSNATLAAKNPLRYRGYEYDTETGLYYLGARYYDPTVGRFLNADSQIAGIGANIHGYNLFEYCFNNPVNLSDPTGEWPFFAITAAIGAVVGAVVGGVIAATNGKNVVAGVAIGAAAGALVGTGVGAAAGIALGGSITASTGAVVAGGKVAVGVGASVATAMSVSAKQLFDRCATHIFSNDHIKNGIMQLGTSRQDIFNKIYNIANNSMSKAVTGSNQINTTINGIKTTVRFYIENGKIQNINAFVGWTERVLGNLIK